MLKRLMLAIGILNLLFFLFHLLLIVGIQHSATLVPDDKALMHTFNLVGSLFIGFLAYTALFRPDDVLTTRLGAATLWLGAATYLLRIVAEPLFSPRLSVEIVGACFPMVALYAAVLAKK